MTEKHVDTWSSWFDGERASTDFLIDREQEILLQDELDLFKGSLQFEDRKKIAVNDNSESGSTTFNNLCN